MRRWIVISTLLMAALLACWLFGQIVRAESAPAVAFALGERGAVLTWLNTRDADSITVRRCHKAECRFVDIVATAPGRPHRLSDPDAQSGDTYYLSAYRARSGGLDFVHDDGPYAVPFARLLPQVQP